MAPPAHTRSGGKAAGKSKSKTGAADEPYLSRIKTAFSQYANLEYGKRVLTDPEYTGVVSAILLIGELFINSLIIVNRSYTEIDWRAYMQEVEGFVNGTLDYQYLRGDTGPLVYPAGFVYIFTVLYYLTSHGANIQLAQWIFGGIYMVLMWQVHRIYKEAGKVPPYLLCFLTLTSYRIHSLFVLRLFNDPIAMLLTYTSINCFLRGRWTAGSLAYSLAVSVKMNVLLFAPALLAVYLTQLSLFDTAVQLAVCGSLQVALSLPFLLVNPVSYLSNSFNLGRVFMYEWTVNWKFLPEEYFLNRWFHITLLTLHLITLFIFTQPWLRYLRAHYNLKSAAESSEGRKAMKIRSQLVLLPLLSSNFIGICFSRSLHYQFYVWYYHSVPYLLWCTGMPTQMRLALFGLIELCWNIFPATPLSSCVLQLCHLCLLGGVWQYMRPLGRDVTVKSR